MSDEPTITIPRDLFERLIDHAKGLKYELSWMFDRPRPGRKSQWDAVVASLREAEDVRKHGGTQ